MQARSLVARGRPNPMKVSPELESAVLKQADRVTHAKSVGPPVDWFTAPLWFAGVKLVSPNHTKHWMYQWKAKQAHEKALAWLLACQPPTIGSGLTITLTRCGGKRMDGDNLQSAFKGLRDLLADWLRPGLAPGQADGDSRLEWRYGQRAGDVGIEVVLTRVCA